MRGGAFTDAELAALTVQPTYICGSKKVSDTDVRTYTVVPATVPPAVAGPDRTGLAADIVVFGLYKMNISGTNTYFTIDHTKKPVHGIYARA